MRVAVVSDVHSNLHALEAVLAEIDAEGFDTIWCLGDVVGYGPRPNECAALLEQRAAVCLAGNHDLVVAGKISLATFAGEAAAAAAWTRQVLDQSARAFLDSLLPSSATMEAELFHGSPRDPVWDYVLTGEVARVSFALTTAPLVLVGHSHVPLQLSSDDEGELSGGQADAGTTVALAGARRLLNPGSVGQPRDGDPRAAWLEIDNAPIDNRTARAIFRRTAYPVERTQSEMREAGLPEALAERLEHGV